MVLMVLWQFDNSAPAARDSWWLDMKIETLMLCEQTLRLSGRSSSKIYFHYGDQIMYCIDKVIMTQQYLRSGRTRQMRRIEVLSFHVRDGYFREHAAPETSCSLLRETRSDWKEERKWKAALKPPRKSSHRDRS